MIVLRKSFYIHWSAGRSPRVHEVNPGRDPSVTFDCNLQHSINENEMNFQYLESVDYELLHSSLQNMETILSLNENSQENSSS